jgi:hypothetical protein
MVVSISNSPEADVPVPFGYKVAWFALSTDNPRAAADALGLHEIRLSRWAEGVEAAYGLHVFVTPPLNGWVLAVGRSFFPPNLPEPFVKPLIQRLSRPFSAAQYFCTYRVSENHIWAIASEGRLVRGFAYDGSRGETQWDEGKQTKEERVLGFRFFDERSADAAEPGYWDRKDLGFPNECSVMKLAELWSVDPTVLDERFKEPSLGLLGSFVSEH